MSEKTDILKKLDSYKDYANSYQQKQKGSADSYDIATNNLNKCQGEGNGIRKT
jgi:hypothetical protein